MAKIKLKGKSLLKGKKVKGPKIVTPGAARKAYSVFEKKNGPVAAIENAAYGRKQDAITAWHQNRQNVKAANKAAKSTSKVTTKSQNIPDKAATTAFKNEYVKAQNDKIKVWEGKKTNALSKGNDRAVRQYDSKIGDAKLKISEANNKGFYKIDSSGKSIAMSKSDIAAARKFGNKQTRLDKLQSKKIKADKRIKELEGKIQTYGHGKDRQITSAQKDITKLKKKSSNANRRINTPSNSKDLYDLSPGEIVKKIPAKRVASGNRTASDKIEQALAKEAKARFDKADYGIEELELYHRTRTRYDITKAKMSKGKTLKTSDIDRQKTRENILTSFEKKHGLKRGDVPENIYGEKGHLRYQRVQGDFKNTRRTSRDVAEAAEDKFRNTGPDQGKDITGSASSTFGYEGGQSRTRAQEAAQAGIIKQVKLRSSHEVKRAPYDHYGPVKIKGRGSSNTIATKGFFKKAKETIDKKTNIPKKVKVVKPAPPKSMSLKKIPGTKTLDLTKTKNTIMASKGDIGSEQLKKYTVSWDKTTVTSDKSKQFPKGEPYVTYKKRAKVKTSADYAKVTKANKKKIKLKIKKS